MGPVTVRAELDCYDSDLETSQWRTTFVIDQSPAYWSIVLRDPEAQRCAVQRRTADGLCAAIYDNIEKTLTVVSAGTVFRSGETTVIVTTDHSWSCRTTG